MSENEASPSHEDRNQSIPTHTNNDIENAESEENTQEMNMVKEKFAKLLLGEDMSGGGKGVSSALALSNAITNVAGSVFGEIRKLEPISEDRKERWKREIDWLLSVSYHIVEFVPSKQTSPDGTTMEVMTTKQRNDLLTNIPALKRLDAMLFGCLDEFKGRHEFFYMSMSSEPTKKKKGEKRKDEKWWIPTPKVPAEGLSETARRWLLKQKESVYQVLKAAMAINAQILAQMEIPETYIESLPKNGRESLGDAIYKSITDDYFDADTFISTIDLSSEHKILDLKNKIEASVIIWRRKMNANKDGKSNWSSSVSAGKRERFEERAESILLILKHKFPGTPQSALEASKIQYNMDIGKGILESYSRTIETLASTVLSRIDDVLYADEIVRHPSSRSMKKRHPFIKDNSTVIGSPNFPNVRGDVDKVIPKNEAKKEDLSDASMLKQLKYIM